MEITVRPAVEQDLAALLALHRELNPDDAPLPPESALAVWRCVAGSGGGRSWSRRRRTGWWSVRPTAS
ncbi:hypothetical protein [Streptomyces sp. NPDC088864]|uniref:hypothetical protein n=1 Tax=Streptomyces sp. NPDC088864 TaxID=3365910 RepID=UPI00380A235A